jgi:hypothetical protein
VCKEVQTRNLFQTILQMPLHVDGTLVVATCTHFTAMKVKSV